MTQVIFEISLTAFGMSNQIESGSSTGWVRAWDSLLNPLSILVGAGDSLLEPWNKAWASSRMVKEISSRIDSRKVG